VIHCWVTDGKWFAGDDPDMDAIEWTPGVHPLMKNGWPTLVIIKKIEDPVPLPFDDAKADILTGYQDWLTSEWLKQLTEKYTVKIDNRVFEEVKERINNE
jgi:peptidyl-prolyl cis-trans isomerase SurA